MKIRGGPRSNLRARNRNRWLLGTLTSALVLAVGISAWFVFPLTSDPSRADVVLVVAGSSDGRHELGAELVLQGVADTLVISNPSGRKDRVGWAHCAGESRPGGAETKCMHPLPVTTTGEARTFGRLAAEESWSSAVVVTNRTHTHRVRSNFEQCTDLETTVANIDRVNWPRLPYHVAREIGGYLKFWVNNPC